MSPRHLPKVIGADVELGNFVQGLELSNGTGQEAACLLLREFDGVLAAPPPRVTYASGGSHGGPSGDAASGGGAFFATSSRRGNGRARHPVGAAPDMPSPSVRAEQDHDGDGLVTAAPRADEREDDWARRYLPANGGCVYIDQGHLELAAPEVRSAFDHVATWHAMLRIARAALEDANAAMPPGQRIRALVNNSDGLGNSYGSHLSVLVTRRAFENLFERRLHYLLWLAGFQVSSIVWSGQGKVGSENGAPPADFQLAQRADFFESLVGPQTTYARPLVNSRDEPHLGGGRAARGAGARVHVIFFDNALAPTACLLRAGTLQILLAMIEADEVDAGLLLEDPIAALRTFSRDLGLATRARTCDGRRLSALELQRLHWERARRFVAREGLGDVVPRAAEILALWGATLDLLERRDLPALARRVDWALKWTLLERARAARPGLAFEDAPLRHLDQIYGSLDEDGLFFALARAGAVEPVVEERAIERFVSEPPDDTRAWTRAALLRHAGARRVEGIEWDRIRFRSGGMEDGWGSWSIELPDPAGHGRDAIAPLLEGDVDLDELLGPLGATPVLTGTERRER